MNGNEKFGADDSMHRRIVAAALDQEATALGPCMLEGMLEGIGKTVGASSLVVLSVLYMALQRRIGAEQCRWHIVPRGADEYAARYVDPYWGRNRETQPMDLPLASTCCMMFDVSEQMGFPMSVSQQDLAGRVEAARVVQEQDG